MVILESSVTGYKEFEEKTREGGLWLKLAKKTAELVMIGRVIYIKSETRDTGCLLSLTLLFL
ncbi:hypothetical protein AVM72_15610 [Piscirickettsia salmonis]|nr:hypothetical protein PSLF89_1022 [Piscirickettsia salmonis LF-89 = ATCC VR-1361]ALY01901.1 hypothetical protein AWE47_02635 [Piscirickettsia salmonis]AMA41410.1 hypothetical protein AWJ11_02620 [Piscirickettsia salmonis]AOS36614.1 hypothetical protein AVM72_15610 [Piscirickettsia salmonis]APS64536.1 hypothetical protein AVI54_12550 [Piscirickettsia salmonis]